MRNPQTTATAWRGRARGALRGGGCKDPVLRVQVPPWAEQESLPSPQTPPAVGLHCAAGSLPRRLPKSRVAAAAPKAGPGQDGRGQG